MPQFPVVCKSSYDTRLFSIRFTGAQIWNEIYPEIKQLPNLCLFKKGFRHFVTSNNILELESS